MKSNIVKVLGIAAGTSAATLMGATQAQAIEPIDPFTTEQTINQDDVTLDSSNNFSKTFETNYKTVSELFDGKGGSRKLTLEATTPDDDGQTGNIFAGVTNEQNNDPLFEIDEDTNFNLKATLDYDPDPSSVNLQDDASALVVDTPSDDEAQVDLTLDDGTDAFTASESGTKGDRLKFELSEFEDNNVETDSVTGATIDLSTPTSTSADASVTSKEAPFEAETSMGLVAVAGFFGYRKFRQYKAKRNNDLIGE